MVNVFAIMGRIAKCHSRAHPSVLLCFLLILTSSSAYAERLPVKTYTSADGLGSGFLNDLKRDSRGFMWFCTRDGLSRFDGARFVTYRVGNRGEPPSIEGITETRDGSYWITTTGGLYRFKRDAVSQPNATTGNRPTLNAEFISPFRGGVIEDRLGNIWLAGGSLLHLEEKDGTIAFQSVNLNLPVPPNRRSGVISVIEAGDGSLWIDTSAGLVRRLPDERLIFYPIETFVSTDDRMCFVDAEGRVWYVLGLELYVLKPEPPEALANLGALTVRPLHPTYVLPAKTETEIRLPENPGEILGFTAGDFLAQDRGHKIYQTSDRHIWLTTAKELIEFDGRVFHRFTIAQGLPIGMSKIAEDSGGNLWIAGQAVLVRLDRKGLLSYGQPDGFHSDSIQAIIEAKDGTLYFADRDYYLTRFAGNTIETKRLPVPANAKSLWTSKFAFLDSRNEWWILTDERLYRFSASNFTKPLASYTSRDGLKADAMFQIHERRNGDIWVSVRTDTETNGVAVFDRALNRFHTFTEAEGYPRGKSVSSFAEDNTGNLWCGFYEGGLVRYANGRFTQFKVADGLPEGVIIDMQVDRSGRLWIGATTGGVARIDDPAVETPHFVSLTTNDGLSSNNIRTLTEDKLGNIYLGTVRGVDRISPDTNYIKHYSVSDGLAGDFVVDSHCDRNGVLWFATTNGLSRLTPAEDGPHLAPPVWLGGLSIAGIPQALYELGESEIGRLELAPTRNNVQVDFFGLDFHAGESLRYQYRLEGADADWSAPTEQRSVMYGNLQPGTYRFLVRAISSQGLASENPAIVSFKILPPFWLRWWFVMIAAIVIGSAAYTFAHSRYQRIKAIREADEAKRRGREERFAELERVRRRIATDLHDDIGSSLTQISILSEVVQQRTGANDSQLSAPLAMIASASRELVDSMSDIVWAINPQKDHLNDLTQRMRRFASDVLTSRDIAFEFNEPDEENDVPLGANIRREVFLIFKESVNNLVRHSGCSEVKIDFQIDGDLLNLTVSDDGKGFDRSVNGDGHGLSSMGQRAAGIGGRLDIISRPGEGATIALELPLPGSATISPLNTT